MKRAGTARSMLIQKLPAHKHCQHPFSYDIEMFKCFWGWRKTY